MAAAAAAVLLQAQDESRAAAAKPVNEPQHLVLPGGTRLPLLGLGTFQLQSADAVRKALERELFWVGSWSVVYSLQLWGSRLASCRARTPCARRWSASDLARGSLTIVGARYTAQSAVHPASWCLWIGLWDSAPR